jgi:predicted secreted protein
MSDLTVADDPDAPLTAAPVRLSADLAVAPDVEAVSAVPVSIASRRKVAFVAHCLLNQNAKVDEFARTAGAVPGVIDALGRHGYRLQQLPCPEMSFAGVGRWWQGKEMYDKPNYRRHCRSLAERSADVLEQFLERDYDVVVVGLDGSPSSGVRFTGSAEPWGGRPEFTDGDYTVVPGMGVWMEELKAEIERRGLPWPRATGVLFDSTDWVEERDMPLQMAELDAFLDEGDER